MEQPFDYSASISFMDVREFLPSIDPENLLPQDVLDILLYVFSMKDGFVDRGHEPNNAETAWINGYLFRLKVKNPELFEVENIGSSVDKMAALRNSS